MERATFEDRITRSSSDGKQSILFGPKNVYCDVIPEDAPQDWSMGPKLIPGQFGVFLEHLYYPLHHGPYAIVTAKNPDDAKKAAAGLFRKQISAWEFVE